MRRITIRPVGSAGEQAFVLGDDALARGTGSKLVLGIRPRYDGSVQRVQYVRSDEPDQFDRKGETTDLVAEVLYEFPTDVACDAFILDLAANVPRFGRLTITTTGPSGTTSRTLDNCWCRPIEVLDQVGVSATVRFTFTGGKLVVFPDAT